MAETQEEASRRAMRVLIRDQSEAWRLVNDERFFLEFKNLMIEFFILKELVVGPFDYLYDIPDVHLFRKYLLEIQENRTVEERQRLSAALGKAYRSMPTLSDRNSNTLSIGAVPAIVQPISPLLLPLHSNETSPNKCSQARSQQNAYFLMCAIFNCLIDTVSLTAMYFESRASIVVMVALSQKIPSNNR